MQFIKSIDKVNKVFFDIGIFFSKLLDLFIGFKLRSKALLHPLPYLPSPL